MDLEDVLNDIPVGGKEMGIAELLDDSSTLKRNWQFLAQLLGVDARSNFYESCSTDFVVRATFILRDWVAANKGKATLEKLTNVLNGKSIFESAARIRKMFDRSDAFEEKWEYQDFEQSPLTISGREKQIVTILDDNPSFCCYTVRLFLMLNLPMKYFKLYESNSEFNKSATAMLVIWKEVNGEKATVQMLATLLVQNGHPCTAEKIRALVD